jgi:hypothetical protein
LHVSLFCFYFCSSFMVYVWIWRKIRRNHF